MQIIKVNQLPKDHSCIYLIRKETDMASYNFSKDEMEYIRKKLAEDKKYAIINSYSRWNYIQLVENDKPVYQVKEELRKAADKLYVQLKENKHKEIVIVDDYGNPDFVFAFIEGLALSNYQFLKYFKEDGDKKSPLGTIKILSSSLSGNQAEELQSLIRAVFIARDLINEPVSYLTAQQLAKEAEKIGKEAGFKVEVFKKKKIEALKMGGLLAVNKGSIDPPTFSVLEWKPQHAVNERPIILVGKGVVYDTGGLSLKPTSSMDTMKSDMSGAAAVIGTFFAVAKANLPVNLIGLIPSTDNRPDGNAYAPGDVIKMYNGMTVEVLNADAEGRMILADALSYAKQYGPELVIDLATLTGSAAMAIGAQGMVAMGTATPEIFEQIKESGHNVHERIVEFPFWDEYKEMLKSDIADIKNIGEKEAGAITAGKFLEHFTDYPWIHLDIAGPAFLSKKDSYRGKGGVGVGVRLLFDFIRKKVKANV